MLIAWLVVVLIGNGLSANDELRPRFVLTSMLKQRPAFRNPYLWRLLLAPFFVELVCYATFSGRDDVCTRDEASKGRQSRAILGRLVA